MRLFFFRHCSGELFGSFLFVLYFVVVLLIFLLLCCYSLFQPLLYFLPYWSVSSSLPASPFCKCHLSCPLQAPLESELVKGYQVEGNLIYEERQLHASAGGL